MSGAEKSILEVQAAVYNYDSNTRNWAPQDGGLSRVFIFFNPTTGAYRVIGQSIQDKQYNINSPIKTELVHKKLRENFVQWRFRDTIYGLSFSSATDADTFYNMLTKVVERLQATASGSLAAQPPLAPGRVISGYASVPPQQPDTPEQDAESLRRASAPPDPAGRGRGRGRGRGMPGPPGAELPPAGGSGVRGRVTFSAGAAAAGGGGVGGSASSGLRGGLPLGGPSRAEERMALRREVKSMEISSAMMQHSFAKQALEAGTYESLPLPTSLPLDSLSSFSNTSPTNSSYLPQPNSPTSALPPDIGGVPLPDDPSAGPPSPMSHARAQSQYGTSSPLAGTPGYTSDSSSHFGTMRRTNSGGPRPRVALFNAENSELAPRDLRAKEIYTTELTYCGILDVIIEDFMQPATKKNVFSPQEYRTIFSNIESIRNFNKDLLAAIRVQMADWTPETTIGDIFLKKIPFLKIYTTYCNNHSSANQLLEKIQSRKNVAQFLKECQKKDFDLNALLITPVQRIPRYQLLLKELISFTEESHPDYANLKSALEQIKKIADEINDAVLRSDSTKEVHTLSKMIPGIQKLLTGSRQLVKHGPVDVTSAEAKYSYLLLFSDVLVFASPMPKGKKLELREKLQLEHVWADDMKDTTSADTAWQLVSPESTYLVQSPNKEDKIIWVDKCHQRTLACCERLGIVDDAMPLGKRKMEYTFRNGAVYSGEWFNGKMHGQGTFTSPDSTTYEGGYANGKFEGHGKITYLTSESYEGQWLKGKPHGEGTLKLLTGTYTGTWENGNQCGQGKVVYSSGDSYEGGFKDNLREGKGVLRGADGSVYEGDWKADKQCGKGKLKNHLGTYEGGWLNDQRNGQGTMTYNNGDKFEGTWSDDRRNGKGTLTSADSTFKYDGEWKDDLMEGQGTLIINQTKYEGMLKAGKRYGEGTYTTPTGTYSGNWADDRREGKGKWVRTDGSVYEGEWHSDLRFGKGTQIDPDGSRYDGKWVKGRREGSGVQTYPNGSKYSGSWARDRRHGQGVFATANDAAKYVGDWVYDNREGSGVMTDSSGTYDGAWKNDMRNGAGVFKYANGMVFTGEWQNDKRHGMGQLTFPDGKRPPIQVQYESGVLVSPAFAELPPDLGLSRALFKA